MKDAVEEALRVSFPDAVEIECQEHGGGHVSIRVVSERFEGLNRLAKQRLVLSSIKELMDPATGVVHAVDKIEVVVPA